MKKALSKFLLYVLCVATAAFLLNLFVGDSIGAHVANWGWVKKYNLVQPRAPLIIHTREEVRVNETNDIIALLNKSQGKVAALVTLTDFGPKLVGSAVAVTSDGVFMTSKSAVGSYKPEQLTVVLSDGKRYPVTSVIPDPATGLVAIRAKSSSVSVVSFAATSDLSAGQRVMLLAANSDGGAYFLTSFLSSAEQISPGAHSSDMPARSLLMQNVVGTIPGQAVFNMSGQLAGLWEGQYVLPASVVQEAVESLLALQTRIARPVFGFWYRSITNTEADRLNLTEGLLIVKPSAIVPAVVLGSPASKAGLREGDIIIQINGQPVSGTAVPDVLLTGQAPEAKATFEVRRAGTTVQIEIMPTNH